MIRRPPRSTLDRSSAASDVYKRQAYDHEGENTLTAGGTPLIAKVGYNERGQLVYLERTSGPATTFAYHGPGSNFGRLSLIRHGTAGDAYPDYSYSGYDSAGNLTGVTVTNANAGSYAYTYDDLNRLATATLSGAGAADFSYTYSYNRLGNLMGRTGTCLLYTSPSPRDRTRSRMPSSA